MVRALIYRFLALKYKTFMTHYDMIKLQQRDSDSVMETFRYPMVTYLTHTTFLHLTLELNSQFEMISKSDKPDEIELETMLSIIKILNANLQALNYCQVNLSSLLINEQQYNDFMNHLMAGSIFKFAQGTEQQQGKASESEK